jgi:hypothetical protein
VVNLGLNGVTSLIMILAMRDAHRGNDADPLGGVLVLNVSSALSALITLFAPRHALWVLLLNVLPVFSRTAHVVRRGRRPRSVE